MLSLEKSADEQASASMRQVKITKFFHLMFNVYAVCKFSNIEVIYMSNKNKICIYKTVVFLSYYKILNINEKTQPIPRIMRSRLIAKHFGCALGVRYIQRLL